MNKIAALAVLAALSSTPAAAGPRLNLRLFGPLSPERQAPDGFHQEFGAEQAEGFLPSGAHAQAPIEWAPTILGFIAGTGVSLTVNLVMRGQAGSLSKNFPSDPDAWHPFDAKVAMGALRIVINAPLVALAVWGLNEAVSDIHTFPYLWPYLAGLICDAILYGADIGLSKATEEGGGGGTAVQAPKGSKVADAIEVIMLVLGAIAIPLAEEMMAQRVRDPAGQDMGGMIIGSIEPVELRPSRVDYATTSTLLSTSF